LVASCLRGHSGRLTPPLRRAQTLTLIPQADMAPGEQRTLLAEYTDLLRLSLAGNLRDYELVNAAGARLAGRRVLYNGVPAAYAESPDESVQYAACHDNETLFDQARARPVSQACAAVWSRSPACRALLVQGVVKESCRQVHEPGCHEGRAPPTA